MLNRFLTGECQRPAAILVATLRHSGHARREGNIIAFANALGVADEGLPTSHVQTLVQRGAYARFPAPALELSGDNPRIVGYQNVSPPKHCRQVAYGEIAECAVGWHHEHARGIARTGRA